MNTIKKIALVSLLGVTMTSNSKVLVINQDNYQQTIESTSKPIILDFYADWCQPCKMMKPIFEELSELYADEYVFAQINFDNNSALAMHYGVSALPTFVVVKDNERIGSITGYVPKEQFITKLAGIFNPKAVSALTMDEQAAALQDAIVAGDSEKLQSLIDEGVKVNIVFSDGQTPLFLAAVRLVQHPQGHTIIKMLLDAGASTKLNFPGQPTMEMYDFLAQMNASYAVMIDAYSKLLPLFDVAPKDDNENCADGVCKIR